MTCSLYAGTIVYHPTCLSGYNYYYNGCCNVRWYTAWNILVVIFAIVFISIITILIIKCNRRRKEQKKAKLSLYQSEELLRYSDAVSEVGRYSVPGEEAIMMKAPRASAFSDASNDQRATALYG